MDTPWGPGSIPGEGSQIVLLDLPTGIRTYTCFCQRDTYIHVFLSEPGPA